MSSESFFFVFSRYNSINSLDISHGNNRFWALQKKAVARRVWEDAKKLGVEGVQPDERYV